MHFTGPLADVHKKSIKQYISDDYTWSDGYALLVRCNAEGDLQSEKGQEMMCEAFNKLRLPEMATPDECASHILKYHEFYYKIQLNATHTMTTMWTSLLRKLPNDKKETNSAKLRSWLAERVEDQKGWLLNPSQAAQRVLKFTQDSGFPASTPAMLPLAAQQQGGRPRQAQAQRQPQQQQQQPQQPRNGKRPRPKADDCTCNRCDSWICAVERTGKKPDGTQKCVIYDYTCHFP